MSCWLIRWIFGWSNWSLKHGRSRRFDFPKVVIIWEHSVVSFGAHKWATPWETLYKIRATSTFSNGHLLYGSLFLWTTFNNNAVTILLLPFLKITMHSSRTFSSFFIPNHTRRGSTTSSTWPFVVDRESLESLQTDSIAYWSFDCRVNLNQSKAYP